MSHTDKNVKLLFACLDWRLHPEIEKFFSGGKKGCDMCVTAGSVKGLLDESSREYLLDQVGVSLKLHGCQAVILTMHLDCGAYGGSAAFDGPEAEIENCKAQLAEAETAVKKRYPGLPVEKYVIGLAQSNGEWVIKPFRI